MKTKQKLIQKEQQDDLKRDDSVSQKDYQRSKVKKLQDFHTNQINDFLLE